MMTAQAIGRREMPSAYDPRAVEQRLYEFWESRGYFTPVLTNPGDPPPAYGMPVDRRTPPFTIIMPPPNVTGELHLGHALTAAIEDALIRWHRMRGEPTLWLPGTDHAGIATQMVVERELAKEGLTRHDLGREAFVERIWQWVRRYRRTIDDQHRRLGASCDWTRVRFTLDEIPALAVRTTFKRLYDDGLIYRGERLINWCPRCMTALSDLEVDRGDPEPGFLWYVRYPVIDDEGRETGTYVEMATTRPETILGDTAVAVHPADERYRHLVGRRARLPIIGRELPIIADEAVDPAFGTGAVKVTPGHDPTDWEIGRRHDLPIVNVMHPDATMNDNAGPFAGLDRFEAREEVVKAFQGADLLARVQPHALVLGRCDRCETIVEPLVSTQWFVKIQPLAAPAVAAVREGHIRIIPAAFEKVYFNWMENIRDWCISRQLWWGHRIPVWYCDACDETIVEIDTPAACTRCGSSALRQDEDVLDTWFSSALWPHSTLGWPHDTEDLRYFYPTSVMETGYDILFFWVARMIMLGLYNMNGVEPFRDVYLHGLVRDAHGVKMSKTKGNVVDPLELVERYGADALRFTLATGSSPGTDMRLQTSDLENARNFANKLWNTARFVLTGAAATARGAAAPAEGTAPIEDRWILGRAAALAAEVNRLLGDFQIAEAGRRLYDFVWHEYADWYIEMAKVRLRRGDGSPLPVLTAVLDTCLRLLHPFMPFVTEEIWQNVRHLFDPAAPEALVIAPYPTGDATAVDAAAARQTEALMEAVRAIRNLRAEQKLDPGRLVPVWLAVPDHTLRGAFTARAELIEGLARVSPLQIVADAAAAPASSVVTAVLADATVALSLEGLVDLDAERDRLRQAMAKDETYIAHLEGQIAKARGRAPERVVAGMEENLAAARARLDALHARLRELG
jgi:valyl-tRNA synthetase